MWEIGLVTKFDKRRDLVRACAHAFPLFAELNVFKHGVFVSIDLRINRIDRDYRGKHALRTRAGLDEVTDFDALFPHSSLDRRFPLSDLKLHPAQILCS